MKFFRPAGLVLFAALVSIPLALWLAPAQESPLPALYPMPDFELVDERGEPFGARMLRGQVVVANFIFTRCPTVCPMLTSKMAKLQAEFASDAGVRLLSISVDPKNDTPEVLASYGRDVGADPARWTFLTGELGAIEEAVERGFKVHVDGVAEGKSAFDIVHGEHFVLIDAAGIIRGYYQPGDEDQARLIRDVRRLLAED